MTNSTIIKIKDGLDILNQLIELFQEAQDAGEDQIELPEQVTEVFKSLDQAELELDLSIAKAELKEAD